MRDLMEKFSMMRDRYTHFATLFNVTRYFFLRILENKWLFFLFILNIRKLQCSI